MQRNCLANRNATNVGNAKDLHGKLHGIFPASSSAVPATQSQSETRCSYTETVRGNLFDWSRTGVQPSALLMHNERRGILSHCPTDVL